MDLDLSLSSRQYSSCFPVGSSRCLIDCKRTAMDAMYVLGGFISLGLLVYLLIALLMPEKF